MATTRIKIIRATRCDLRAYGSDESRVESVEVGEVHEVVEEVYQNMIHSAACVKTIDPIKNRFVKPVIAPPVKPVIAPPVKPVIAPPVKPVV